MKRVITYVLVNGLYSAAIYLAIFKGNGGAENIVIAATWFMFFVSMLCLTDAAVETLKKKGRSVPQWLDACFDLSVIGVFIYSGWWATGIAYIIHSLLISVAWQKVALSKADQDEGTPC